GQGRPLELEDLSHLPPELRLTYKILKNSGYVSPETEDRKEIGNILEMLDNTTDEKERYQQVQKLNFLVMKINEQRKSPVNLEVDQVYYQKVLERVEVNRVGNK
ncbi:MAG: DnaJ family domain-containing protein, partial [Thermodesulfobacteriota bacterium]